ncbi:hypothetical protein V6N13_141162 [Hibiscus sabdariffa]
MRDKGYSTIGTLSYKFGDKGIMLGDRVRLPREESKAISDKLRVSIVNGSDGVDLPEESCRSGNTWVL